MCVSFFIIPLSAQWAKGVGSTTNDDGNAMAVDGSGNSYVIGNFTGTVDFDPSGGISNLTANGSFADVFFAKYNSTGDLVLAYKLGSSTNDAGNAIAIDAGGNIYITGFIAGTTNFDVLGGSYDLTPVGSSDIFVAKYNSSASLQWAFVIGQSTQDIGYGIAVDGSGNVFVTGYFKNTVDFNPGAGTNNLTADGITEDTFIAKYNSGGQLSWVKQIGGTGTEETFGITLDAAANIYITGKFTGPCDFNPSGSTNILTSAGGFDAFVAKYDSSGTYQWARNIGGTTDDIGKSIAVDASNEVYVTGSFTGTADFDPGVNGDTKSSNGLQDIFFEKYDASGNWVWDNSIGGTGDDIGNRIVIDGSSNVVIAGSFSGTADFDPTATTSNLTSAGGTDIFIGKYTTADGYKVWAKNMGGSSDDAANGVGVAGSFVYSTGSFQSTADFDPGASTSNLISAGARDIFFAKYQETNGLLPVELTSFTAKAKGDRVEFAWKTATEINNYGFEIQRSRSQKSEVRNQNIPAAWDKIGFVEGAGTTNAPKEYLFSDKNLSAGKYSYRLKQIDRDGHFTYSSEVEMTIVKMPKEFALAQNYPNPFNPSTVISYQIPVNSRVSLKIFDAIGREVAVLVNEVKEAGYYSATFDAAGLSSGIYFVGLQSTNNLRVKKMTLLK